MTFLDGVNAFSQIPSETLSCYPKRGKHTLTCLSSAACFQSEKRTGTGMS